MRPVNHQRSLAFTRLAAVAITLGIGVASFVLSFAALADLAARSGIPERLAWLWPLIVDGTILQATMAVVALSGREGQGRNRRYFWIVLSAAAAVSVVANGWHAVLPTEAPLSPWLAVAIAVVAPVSLLASTHGLSLLIRVTSPRAGRRRLEEVQRDPEPDAPVPWYPVDQGPDAEDVPDAPVAAEALQPWAAVAEVLATRMPEWQIDAETVAAVLHLRYERESSPRAIAAQLGIEQRLAREIVSAGEELLRSGDVSVERVAV